MLLFNNRCLPLHSIFIDRRPAQYQVEAKRCKLLRVGVAQLVGRVENHGPGAHPFLLCVVAAGPVARGEGHRGHLLVGVQAVFGESLRVLVEVAGDAHYAEKGHGRGDLGSQRMFLTRDQVISLEVRD